MDITVIVFTLLILAIVICYYVFLTWSLIRVCSENSKKWIIVMVASYFIGLLGAIPLGIYWFGEETRQESKTQSAKFNLGRHVIYVLKKQLIPTLTILAFFVYGSFWVSRTAGPAEAFPIIAAMLFVFAYSLYITLLTFILLYIPKLIYLTKAKKPRSWIVKILSIIPELSRWYVLLLFAVAVYDTFAGWAFHISTDWLLMAALIISGVIGMGYEE